MEMPPKEVDYQANASTLSINEVHFNPGKALWVGMTHFPVITGKHALNSCCNKIHTKTFS